MTAVFVDTWAWYAMIDKADDDHLIAQLTSEELLDRGHTFVTTNFVLDEAITLIRYRVGHAIAVQFRHKIQQMTVGELLNLVRVTAAHEAAAWIIFEKYADQEFSFTDCCSFAVMRAMNLSQVFTADGHFATMGFVRIP
ncbi:type II toxin-antitoxin system VapC family toxin [Candidatus Amarolinea aalborgensis]|jgi:predicted nucleic acid-binding protein|uniref:type II toxin-antitoxin system VapC family toxin n=1 Tax=Candidatus Amarolinea aalborgensis TaxID=2249329 RepID=UPI003BF969F5